MNLSPVLAVISDILYRLLCIFKDYDYTYKIIQCVFLKLIRKLLLYGIIRQKFVLRYISKENPRKLYDNMKKKLEYLSEREDKRAR